MKYGTDSNSIALEGKKIHVREGFYEGIYSTYSWEHEEKECTSSLLQIYSGVGKHIYPENPKFHRQILVRSDFHGITFGLDLKGTTEDCGKEMFKTQMSHIFVILGKKNFFKELEKTRYTL